MGAREINVNGHQLIIHERDDSCDPSTGYTLTGSWLWDSALYLAEWMAAAAPADLRLAGATVLELGAGTGLPGLLAGAMGSARVVLTDVAPLLDGLRASAKANGMEDRVEVRELCWGAAAQEAAVGEVDVVLLSDVFYDAGEMRALASAMRAAWGPRTTGWAASEVRPGVAKCLAALRREGFEATEVEGSVRPLLRAEGETTSFSVYRIQRCPPDAPEDENSSSVV